MQRLAITIVIFVLAGCSSLGGDPEPTPTPESNQEPRAARIAATVEAIVDATAIAATVSAIITVPEVVSQPLSSPVSTIAPTEAAAMSNPSATASPVPRPDPSPVPSVPAPPTPSPTSIATKAPILSSTPSPIVRTVIRGQQDDFQEPQIHFIYAIPSDVTDLDLDTNGAMIRSISAIQNWMRDESGGQEFKIDTFGGEPDITHLPLRERQVEVFNDPRSQFAVISDAIMARELPTKDTVYVVYYSGSSRPGACGAGGPLGDGHVGVVCLGAGCPSLPVSRDMRLRFSDYVIIHEILHALGAVPKCAPHAESGDYFGHDNVGCLDLSDSPYITKASAF